MIFLWYYDVLLAGIQSRSASAEQTEAWSAAELPHQALLHLQHAHHSSVCPRLQPLLHQVCPCQLSARSLGHVWNHILQGPPQCVQEQGLMSWLECIWDKFCELQALALKTMRYFLISSEVLTC